MPEGLYSVQAMAVEYGKGTKGTLVLTLVGYEFNGVQTQLDWEKTACIQGTTRVHSLFRSTKKTYVKFCEGDIISPEFVLDNNKIAELRAKISDLRELVKQKNQVAEKDKEIEKEDTAQEKQNDLLKTDSNPSELILPSLKIQIIRFFLDLNTLYPDKNITDLHNNPKYKEKAKELSRKLGYSDEYAFLDAYGYTVPRKSSNRRERLETPLIIQNVPIQASEKNIDLSEPEPHEISSPEPDQSTPESIDFSEAELDPAVGDLDVTTQVNEEIKDIFEEKSGPHEISSSEPDQSVPENIDFSEAELDPAVADLDVTTQVNEEIKDIFEEKSEPHEISSPEPDQSAPESIDLSETEIDTIVDDLDDLATVNEEPKNDYEEETKLPEAPPSQSDQIEPNQVEPMYLIDGYRVNGDEIISEATGRMIEDVPAETLQLSVRAKNCFIRSKRVMASQDHHKVMISDLLRLTWTQLISVRMLGVGTAEEILTELKRYLAMKSNESVDLTDNGRIDGTQDDHSTSHEEAMPSFFEYGFPELDPHIPVLAPEYAVINGEVCNRKTLKKFCDAPVECLNLDTRASFCLSREGIKMISSLVGMPYFELRNIRNMGIKSANEIIEKLEAYLDEKQKEATDKVTLASVSEGEIIECLLQNEFEPKSYDELLSMLPDAKESDFQEVIRRLSEKQKIVCSDNMYSIYRPSFFDAAQSLAENSENFRRSAWVMQMRMEGSTLDEIAQIAGLTRERVRQLEFKILNRLKNLNEKKYVEDRYEYLFTTYCLEKEFYLKYLNISQKELYYLHLVNAEGKSKPALALEDKKLSVIVRKAIETYIYRGYVLLDGRYIPTRRSDMVAYVIEKYCKDEVSMDDFISIYNGFLNDNGLLTSDLQISEEGKSSWSSRLADSMHLLWKQNSKLRYYDFDGTDFSDLLETLNLEQYHNIELSSRKFFLEYPEVMERYDIRDEYELHNLLKKIHAERENPEMVFKRMPTILFGEFDREKMIKDLLFARAPISRDELAGIIMAEYGFSKETVKAGWLQCIDDYCHQSVYSVEYEDMPDEQMKALKEELTDEFYFIEEIRTIYCKLFPGSNSDLISSYNLKKMGFLVMSSYVVKNYPSAEAYFESLVLNQDVIDLRQVSKRFGRLVTFTAYISIQKSLLHLIEFEPYQYINIRRLELLGYNADRLREYGDRVWSYLEDDDYFTIQSLRRSGFTDELDALGFDELFYSSILKTDNRFAWQRVGNNVVLNPKGYQFRIHDFLVDRICKEKSVDVDTFLNDLNDIYGISLDRYDVIQHVKDSDVYYDSIMDKLYRDYDTYFEEI